MIRDELESKLKLLKNEKDVHDRIVEFSKSKSLECTNISEELNGVLYAYTTIEENLNSKEILYASERCRCCIQIAIASVYMDGNITKDKLIKRIWNYVKGLKLNLKDDLLEQIKLYPNNTYKMNAEDLLMAGVIDDDIDHDIVESDHYEIELNTGETVELLITDVEKYTEEQAIELYKKTVVESK